MWQKVKNVYHLGNAFLANVWFGFPSRSLTVIGVTGTDGKTTTVSLIYHILHTAGYNASMISSVGAIIGGKSYDVGFHVTTPSPWALQRFIKKAARGPVAPSSHPMSSVASSLRALDGTPSSRATPRLSIILDGAHNPTKMRAFIKALKKLFPNQKKIFVVGFKFDKDIPKMLKQIVRAADTIIVTEFHGKTDVNINASMKVSNLIRRSPDQISNLKYDKKIKVMAEGKSKAAFSRALKIPKQSTKQVQDMVRNDNYIIAVTGSLYLVGEVREYLFEIASPNKLGSQ